jgi:hypothetical protein
MARSNTVRRLRDREAFLESELEYVKIQFNSCRAELHELKEYYPDKIAELENAIRCLLAQAHEDIECGWVRCENLELSVANPYGSKTQTGEK